jgi:hypothetical protein
MKHIRFCALFGLQLGMLAAQSPAVDVWNPIRFLVGNWQGKVTGQPGDGTSLREYKFVLNGRFLEVRDKSTYSPQAKNPKGEIHEDWGMISWDRNRMVHVLRQFHAEGFVNQYTGEPMHDAALRFTSESIENTKVETRARETYTEIGPRVY